MGFDGLGHGIDFNGRVVGRGQAEGVICPKGGASQSMTVVWRQQLLWRIVLCEWREGQVMPQCGFEMEDMLGDHTFTSRYPLEERDKKIKGKPSKHLIPVKIHLMATQFFDRI